MSHKTDLNPPVEKGPAASRSDSLDRIVAKVEKYEGDELSPAQVKIVRALTQLQTFGQLQPGREAVAIFAEMSPRSSTFGINVAALKDKGIVEYPSKNLLVLVKSPNGISGGDQSPADLLRTALNLLTRQERRIFEVIHSNGSGMTRADIAMESESSMKSSSFGIALAKMRDMGIVNYLGDGTIKVADFFRS